jgi:glycine/D-amino acid oxidase-like deaminating enzyme/nitrite reductase/ring-hydroxylating ferredoxin subunit
MSQRRSVWIDTTETVAYPALTSTTRVDVVVIGAGITGLTAALILGRRGMSVAVIEALHIAAGTTGHTTGKVTSQHGLIYQSLIERHGTPAAQNYADANQWAIGFVAEAAKQVGPAVEFQRAPAFVYTLEPDKRPLLEAEHAAAASLGLPSELTDQSELPFGFEMAIRFSDQGHLHPGRYCEGLADMVHAEGGLIFERTRALGVKEADGGTIVKTDRGEVEANEVVVATLLPFVDRGGFFAKTRPVRGYGLAVRLNEDPPEGMYLSLDDPTRSLRPWGDRGLIVVGEGHPTGSGDATPQRWGALEQWARDHFDVAEFDYRWSGQDYSSSDGLPYVGRSPRSRHVSVATGFNKWGLTNGTAAGRMLADSIVGEPNPWLSTFAAARFPDRRGVARALIDNAKVGIEFVTGHAARFRAPDIGELHEGQGGIVDLGDSTVGAYRDPAGGLHVVSLTCTHLACTVQWNDAEDTWDCPCHGSRFSIDGDVLEGPATRPLQRLDSDGSELDDGDQS